jgi:hypothetical protein
MCWPPELRIAEGGRIVSFSSSVVGLYQPTYGVTTRTSSRTTQPSPKNSSTGLA